jgi:putative transposase
MSEKHYPSDVSDREWAIFQPLLPQEYEPGPLTGRSRLHAYREVVNSIFYISRGDCAWRMMPYDLPHWSTCYHYFRKWRMDGTLERVHDSLRRQERERKGHKPEASAGILDSQSVKTSVKGGHAAMTEARRSKAANDICW